MSACIPFPGYRDRQGYGRLQHRGAHRVLWERANGPLDSGVSLDHICHNTDPTCAGGGDCPHRRCVNLEHLEPVTQRENTLRGRTLAAANARKTECKHGHPFTPENTRRFTWHGITRRICKTCNRTAVRRHNRAKRSAAT